RCLSPTSLHFPYTTLFRSLHAVLRRVDVAAAGIGLKRIFLDFIGRSKVFRETVKLILRRQGLHKAPIPLQDGVSPCKAQGGQARSEEHTSELQSRFDLVCR